jgi:CheY-like chemotaxis protein
VVELASSVHGLLTPCKLRAALQACHSLQLEEHINKQRPYIRADPIPPQDPLSEPHEAATSAASFREPFPKNSLATCDDEEPLEELSMNSNLEEESSQREPRFLLVDDNAINLKVIGMFAKKCSKLPYILAGGGQEAIDAFTTTQVCHGIHTRAAPFDIIVLDLSMPEVSGFQVASAIRSIEESAAGQPRVYIAALTGLVSDKDREAAFAAGVDEYVTKPATMQDLMGIVANWKKTVATPLAAPNIS